MKIQYRSAFLAALLMLNLGGCTFFSDKPGNTPAELRAALEVPPDLARPASDDLAAVPPSGAAAYSDYAAKSPASPAASASQTGTTAVAADPASASVRLERDGAHRWLVVQGDPGRVWVKARDYFLRSKIALTTDSPQTGILETVWIDRPVQFTGGFFSKIWASAHSSGLRDKFRVRVERGRAPGTAEVYVSHQNLAEVVVVEGGVDVTQTKWEPRAADPEMEAEMLGKLLEHFGMDPQQTKRQMAAVGGTRAQLIKGELIVPQDDLDAVWRRVGQALDRAGVITEDRDRSAGIFYVRYVASGQAGKRKGLFAWLLGDSSTATDDTNDKDYKKELPNDRFQVRLKTTAAGTSVAVFNVNGEPEKSSTGEQLLGVLQQQLF